MTSFALITEGITDQVVIKALLTNHVAGDVDVRMIQPETDATDKSRQGDFGGWERVLAHCTVDNFQTIFSTNDYIVIQIDTDVGEQRNFGLALTEHGGDRPVLDIINSVRDIIAAKFDETFYAAWQDRIIFAIAVHSLECWLLPLYVLPPAQVRKTKNCADVLRYAMKADGQPYAKTHRVYEKICKAFKKTANIQKCRGINDSMNHFLSALPGQSG
jgi:hypothetical protein